MKKLVTLFFSIGLIVNYVSATDLLDVFHQAQTADPTYQQAKATYLSARSTLGQARSVLLPNLSLTGTWTEANSSTTNTGAAAAPVSGGAPTPTATGKADTTVGILTLTQPLFNWAAFKKYAQVKLTVKQAAATYAAAEQSLITRTASAYFAILNAQDNVLYSSAQKRELSRALQVARQRYKVGLDAITSVYDAQAKYDGMKATNLTNANKLAIAKEALREITGQIYPSLARLKNRIPLIKPVPANIDSWTQTAEQQNLTLLATRFGMQAAEENIKVQFAGHLPTLGLTGSYNDTNTNTKKPTASIGTADVGTTSYGASLTVPIYAGGNVSSLTEQAEYDYQTAVAAMDIAHRTAIFNARKGYLGVIAGISQISADRQSVKSAKAAVASNQAAYKVGTQTILNVLTAQSTLYQAQTQYAKDRYQYVTDTLGLKSAAGTLSAQDLQEVNTWLVNKYTKSSPPAAKKKRVRRSTKSARSKTITKKKTSQTRKKKK